MWILPSLLNKHGILGMNRRNVSYISQYNTRSRYPLVDDKLKTKLLAEKFKLSTPKLRGVIKYQYETAYFPKIVENLQGFAVKPAKGSGGKGILVIKERKNGLFVKSSGQIITINDIKRHLSNILAGLYSLAGVPDSVIIEDLIHPSEMFEKLSYDGVPDIRFIVFKGYPIMAMLRLSTKASDGKANLHQGAVGVGLDISTGKGLHAIQHSRRVQKHPDTGLLLNEILVPDWKNLLLLSAKSYEMTKLGYIGADLVVDKSHGAMLLELNARPGLSIQAANGAGLLPRLKKIESIDPDLYFTPEERIEFSMNTFHSNFNKTPVTIKTA
ncbi:MAG: alpha-L-glutamate ligase-like protein [Desulforegulaceae bacterium]|nr:alpha-L-glutamate ligase-like protein [Desulforegulaceae bacterium]